MYGKNYFTLWSITKYCKVYLFIFKYTKLHDFNCARIFSWKQYSTASTPKWLITQIWQAQHSVKLRIPNIPLAHTVEAAMSRLHSPPAVVMSPRANPAAPMRHSHRQAMLCEFNCCQPGNCLTANYRYLYRCRWGAAWSIQSSTMADQVWIVLPSVALTQAAC